MIEWNESYSTGLIDIDAQHKVLIKYINELDKIVKGKGDKSWGHVNNILDFLGNYCKNHFGYEEKCMVERKCPVATQNKASHEKFLLDYKGFKERFMKEGVTDSMLSELHNVASQWLVNHICKIDAELKKTVTINQR